MMENFNKSDSKSSEIDFKSFNNYQEYLDFLRKYYEEEFRNIELQISEGGTTISSRHLEYVKMLKDKIDIALCQSRDSWRSYVNVLNNEYLAYFLKSNHALFFVYIEDSISSFRLNIGTLLEENSKKLEVKQSVVA